MTTRVDFDHSHLQHVLTRSEEFRQLLLDSSLDCIICTDDKARITEFNATATRVFRIPRENALGRDLPDLIFPGASREQYRRLFFTAHNSADIELVGNRMETLVKRSDGKEFPAEFTVSRLCEERLPAFVVCVRDITARRKAEEAMVWLASVVESSQDAIIGKNLDGTIISWNKGAEEMYGYTSAEMIGQSICRLVPAELADEAGSISSQLRNGHQIKSFETVRIAKNGRRINVSMTISPVRRSDGTITGASIIARDITAEKLAQEALRKATETSIYSSPMPIIAADAANCVTIWNPAAEAVFGWSEKEVIGKPLPIIPPEELERSNVLYNRLRSGETITGVEVKRRKKDGSLVTISLTASPLWDENKSIKGIIGFLTDITDRKNAEEALRTAEEKYRSIFENAVEGIYQATPSGKYLSANPALARMLGFDTPEELIATRNDIKQQEYLDPRLRSTFVDTIEREGVVRNFEYQAQRRGGKVLWLSASAHAVRDSSGKLLYFEGMVQDITERRNLEQQVAQMQKIEAIGRLAGGVAHDFNNILMAISSYTELLGKKCTAEAPRRYIAEVATAVSRGSSLTQALLTFSRKQVSSPKVLDLNQLVTQQLDMLRRLIPETIELRFKADPKLGNVKADPNQIEQVIMNLVINARDAMPTGGAVVIETKNAVPGSVESGVSETKNEKEHVLLSVTDNGCGMGPETMSHLFEPFYTTKEQGKGTGLGLATVFGVVKQSMGNISVQSELGRGTTFKVFLPMVDDVERPLQEAEEVRQLSANGETILLVEDESAVRESTAEYLSEHGFKVLKASRGDEGLAIAQKESGPIHLLLSDLVMPRMSGRELAEQLSAIHPETRTIFMSGYSKDLLSNPQDMSANFVLLQKPFHLKALAQSIRKILS